MLWMVLSFSLAILELPDVALDDLLKTPPDSTEVIEREEARMMLQAWLAYVRAHGRPGEVGQAAQRLMPLLTHANPEIRIAGIELLADIGTAVPSVEPRLRLLLQDSDAQARVAAAAALVEMGRRGPELVAVLGAGLATHAYRCLPALRALGGEAAPVLPALVAAAANVEDPSAAAEFEKTAEAIAPGHGREIANARATRLQARVNDAVMRLRAGETSPELLSSLIGLGPAAARPVAERLKTLAGKESLKGDRGPVGDTTGVGGVLVVSPGAMAVRFPVQVLMQIRGTAREPAVPALFDIGRTPTVPVWLRTLAVRLATETALAPGAAIPALTELVRAGQPHELRVAAAEGLVRFGWQARPARATVRLLVGSEPDPNLRVRLQAVLDAAAQPAPAEIEAARAALPAGVWEDPRIGFRFEYPSRYAPRDGRMPDGRLMDVALVDGATYLDVRLVEDEMATLLPFGVPPGARVVTAHGGPLHLRRGRLEDAVREAQLSCDADGPSGSSSCPRILERASPLVRSDPRLLVRSRPGGSRDSCTEARSVVLRAAGALSQEEVGGVRWRARRPRR